MSLKNPVTPPGNFKYKTFFHYPFVSTHGWQLPLKVKVKISRNRPGQAQGVSGWVKAQDFLNLGQYEGGRSPTLGSGRLYPRINPWYSFLEPESTPGHMVPSVDTEKKSPVTPPGIDPETFRLVAQCVNHYAKPGPRQLTAYCKNKEMRGIRMTWIGTPSK